MVFDASASSNGPSLIACLLVGPSLTDPLCSVLLRFRACRFAFIADIETAFLQISLNLTDRDYVRFPWYNDLDNLSTENLDTAELAVYRLCRVLFGLTCSPFLLTGTIIVLAELYLNVDPNLVERFLRSLHFDDLNWF